jgi:hypothetical protein
MVRAWGESSVSVPVRVPVCLVVRTTHTVGMSGTSACLLSFFWFREPQIWNLDQ